MSMKNTQAVKGIAIILVIAAHAMGNFFHVSTDYTNYLGTGGVCLFLILSGYGLYRSYRRNGLHRDFWDKKINKVFVPYWGVTCLFGIYLRSSHTILLKNLLCIDYDRNYDGTMWYMSLLLIEYIAFFMIFYFAGMDIIKITMLFIVGVVIKENTNVFRGCGWQFSHNWLSFPLGVALGYVSSLVSGHTLNCDRIKKILKVIMGPAFLGVYIYGFKAGWGFQVQGVILCMLAVAFVNLVPAVFKKTLVAIGVISYPVYLVEGKLFVIVGRMNAEDSMSVAACVLLYAVLLGVSTALMWLICKLINWKCGLARTEEGQ